MIEWFHLVLSPELHKGQPGFDSPMCQIFKNRPQNIQLPNSSAALGSNQPMRPISVDLPFPYTSTKITLVNRFQCGAEK